MLNKPKTKARKSVSLFFLVPACAAIFLLACVDKDRNVPANPQSIIAGSDSSPVTSKIASQQKVSKSGAFNPDSVIIKP